MIYVESDAYSSIVSKYIMLYILSVASVSSVDKILTWDFLPPLCWWHSARPLLPSLSNTHVSAQIHSTDSRNIIMHGCSSAKTWYQQSHAARPSDSSPHQDLVISLDNPHIFSQYMQPWGNHVPTVPFNSPWYSDMLVSNSPLQYQKNYSSNTLHRTLRCSFCPLIPRVNYCNSPIAGPLLSIIHPLQLILILLVFNLPRISYTTPFLYPTPFHCLPVTAWLRLKTVILPRKPKNLLTSKHHALHLLNLII